MEIIPINDKYIHQIAELHKKAFPKYHFTSRFSIKFLEQYFRCLIKYLEFPYMIIGGNQQLIGYFIGGSNSARAISAFYKEHWLKIILLLLKNPSFIWEKFLIMLDSASIGIKDNSKRYSGYVICVDPDLQIPAAGYVLIKNFEDKLIENNIKEYYVSIRPDNYKVIEWYEKMNFVKFEKKKSTIVYKKTLI